MKKTFSKDIFERYAAGNCTEKEQAMLEAWYLKELQKNEQRPSDQQLKNAQKEIWNNIKPKRKVFPLLIWSSVAAALVLAFLFVYKLQNNHQDKIQQKHQQVFSQTKDTQTEVLLASKIENSMMKLPDGSTVILEKGSKLTLLPAFNENQYRKVKLEGKAFFDIAHNPAKPFIIYAGTVTTTVLGTAFDITAVPGSKSVKVNVIRGLVEVKDEKKHWITVLPKNFQVVFDDKHNIPQKISVDASKELSWNKQDLEFNDISIADAQSRLEEQFGFKISVKDAELRKATFTYSMRIKESPESFIKSICAFIGASYTIDHKNNIISIQPLNQ